MTAKGTNAPPRSFGSLVQLSVDDAIAELRLDNPPLNLMTVPMLNELRAGIQAVRENAALRVLLLHGGSARAFGAGSDMNEFAALRTSGTAAKIMIEALALRDLASLPLPTIAAIEGPALGGGLELALSCDLRIVSSASTLGLPECRVGGLASNGSQRLTRLVGPARAKELLFLGLPIPPAEALRIGMVNRVVEPGTALAVARQLATDLGERAPISIRLAKRLVDTADGTPDAGIPFGVEAQEEIFASQDLLEGVTAFREHRVARFEGR